MQMSWEWVPLSLNEHARADQHREQWLFFFSFTGWSFQFSFQLCHPGHFLKIPPWLLESDWDKYLQTHFFTGFFEVKWIQCEREQIVWSVKKYSKVTFYHQVFCSSMWVLICTRAFILGQMSINQLFRESHLWPFLKHLGRPVVDLSLGAGFLLIIHMRFFPKISFYYCSEVFCCLSWIT